MYRLKSAVYFLLILMTSPLCLFLTLTLWIFGTCRKNGGLPGVETLDESLRRTVLVTGSARTKALHVIRILGKAGHRIIVADWETFKFSNARWSTYVSAFRPVPDIEPENPEGYVRGMVKVAVEENVDWFIPISHTKTSVADTLVKERLARERPSVKCLSFEDSKTTALLDDKVLFLEECCKLGLSVPGFRRIGEIEDVYKIRSEGIFASSHYFLKPLKPCSDDRENFTRIPHQLTRFDGYLESYKPKIGPENPYFVCEFIKGRGFASNAICRDGEVLALQVCPCSSVQIDYDVIEHPAIQEWTLEFCRRKRITGCICFDFIEDETTGLVYCIECNPRLHSSITSYHYDPRLATVFQAALEPEHVPWEGFRVPIAPSINSSHVYWLYQEIYKFFSGQQSFAELYATLRHGKEAVFVSDDPLPFLMLNTVHFLDQLRRGILSGARWDIFDPCVGRLR